MRSRNKQILQTSVGVKAFDMLLLNAFTVKTYILFFNFQLYILFFYARVYMVYV